MSEILEELIAIKRALESSPKDNNEILMQQLSRLNKLPITKNDIRSSKINEILRKMSKNSKQAYNGIIVNQAKKIRENWKIQLSKKSTIPVIKKPMHMIEIQKKIKVDRCSNEKVSNINELKQPKQSLEKPKEDNFDLNDDSSYNNQYIEYYEELEDKKRKNCFIMLNKIFDPLIDIIVRVFRDRLQLKQSAFNDLMKFAFSDFFYKTHNDNLLKKSKK